MPPLWYIAIIPDKDLCERVKQLKLEMKEKYGSSHALKSPAHVTLVMPFRRIEGFGDETSPLLSEFAAGCRPHQIECDGFGSFEAKVIYVDLNPKEPLREVHRNLRELLLTKEIFPPKQIWPKINPHITIATRDLTEDNFHKAWAEYSDRSFSGSFEMNSISLLKHNGKDWDEWRRFDFGQRS